MGHEQRLQQVDVVGRNDQPDNQCAEGIYDHYNTDGEEHGTREVACRIGHIADVHRLNLHSGIEQEYGGCEHDCSEIGEVRKERHMLQIIMFTHAHIQDAEHDERHARDDGAKHTAVGAEHIGRALPAEGIKGGNPVDNQSHNQSVGFVGSQALVKAFGPEYIGKRSCPEHQHRRKPYHNGLPFEKHGRPAPSRAERLGYPPVESAAFRIGRGQFGAHQRERQQEHYRRKRVVEN